MTKWPRHTGNIYPTAYYSRREMQMQCVLAVDGGNTKPIALVAALDGTILGAGRGGCGDIYNAEPGTEWPDSAAAAVANIEYAVLSALEAAQIKASDLLAGVFSMAGGGWAEGVSFFYASLEEGWFARTLFVQDIRVWGFHSGSSRASRVC